MLELFRAAKDKKCIPDRSSYTEAIVAHGRLKQSDQGLAVFRAMQDAGLPPNVVSCALPLTLTSERVRPEEGISERTPRWCSRRGAALVRCFGEVFRSRAPSDAQPRTGRAHGRLRLP